MKLITQQGFVMVDTKHPRDERHFALSHQPTAPNFEMVLDGQGNVVPIKVGDIKRRREPPMRGALLRLGVAVAYGLSAYLVIWAFVVIGPKVPAFLNWITQ